MLSQELQRLVSPEDSYLIALKTAVPESIIVTTDADLAQILSDFPDITIRLRDEFLKEYLEANNT